MSYRSYGDGICTLNDFYVYLRDHHSQRFSGRTEEIKALLEGLVNFVVEVKPTNWTGLATVPQILQRSGRNSDLEKTYNWLRIVCKSKSPVFVSMSHQDRNNFATRMVRIMKYTQAQRQAEDNAKVAVAICKLMTRLFEASTWTEGFPEAFSRTAKAQDGDPSIAQLNKCGDLMLPFKLLNLTKAFFPSAIDVPDGHSYYVDELDLPEELISKYFFNYFELSKINDAFMSLKAIFNRIFFSLAAPNIEETNPSQVMEWFRSQPSKFAALEKKHRLLAVSQAKTNKIREEINLEKAEYQSLKRKMSDFWEEAMIGKKIREVYNRSERCVNFLKWSELMIRNVEIFPASELLIQ